MLKALFGIGRDSSLQDELEEKHIGYKVVTQVNSKSFKPATSSALQSFRYRRDQETRRYKSESGPIAIFSEYDDAAHFAKRYGGHILKVEYVPSDSDEDELWKKNPPSFCRNRWGGGYHAESNGVTTQSLNQCPIGTILAESIYVLEVLE